MFRLINKLKNRKGFTLIELIVVLAVLAIIMAIAVPRFLGVRDEAEIEADGQTLAMAAKAAELYYAKEGSVPTLEQLQSKGYLDDPIARQATDDADASIKFSVTSEGAMTANWD